MNIIIRTDASQQIGSGHVMRCLTLANELTQKAQVSFICRDLPGNMCDYIEQKGFFVHRLPLLGIDWQTDAKQTSAILATDNRLADWLIVDHYSLNAQWEMTMRPYVNKIMVINDIANRKHERDPLLDQNRDGKSFLQDIEMFSESLLPVVLPHLFSTIYRYFKRLDIGVVGVSGLFRKKMKHDTTWRRC